jgi:hypothetical protein
VSLECVPLHVENAGGAVHHETQRALDARVRVLDELPQDERERVRYDVELGVGFQCDALQHGDGARQAHQRRGDQQRVPPLQLNRGTHDTVRQHSEGDSEKQSERR